MGRGDKTGMRRETQGDRHENTNRGLEHCRATLMGHIAPNIAPTPAGAYHWQPRQGTPLACPNANSSPEVFKYSYEVF